MLPNDHFTVVDANAHAQSHSALFAPALIELAQLPPHSQRRARATFRVLRRAKTAHVTPNSHDGVTDKFVEGSAIAENFRSHLREIFIELRDQRFRVGLLRQRRETNQVREQNRHRHAHPTKRAVVAVRVFQNFGD